MQIGVQSGRRLAASAGIIALIAAWLPPLAGIVPAVFARHMLTDTIVMAVAAPLIAVGLAGALRQAGRPLPAPLPASAGLFAVLWLWHVPLLHGLADLSPTVRVLEGLSLLGAGVILWACALRTPAAGDEGSGILALLFTATHVLLLGTLLLLAWRPLYTQDIRTLADVYAHMADQRAGGMVLLLGGVAPLTGGLWLLGRLLRPPRALAGRAMPRAATRRPSRPSALLGSAVDSTH